MADIRERPIIFSGQMVMAILDGLKTQTRRVFKPQPDIIYGLTDERLVVYHTSDVSGGGLHDTEADPCFSERGLHGRKRREDLLSDAVRWVWEEGARGLVLASRSQKHTRLFDCLFVPQQQKGHKGSSQTGMYGLSRNAADRIASGETPEREQGGQRTEQLGMGNTRGKLDGQESAWSRYERGETPDVKIIRHAEGVHSFCRKNGPVFDPARGESAWNVTVCHFSSMPWIIGTILWVRETWLETNGPDKVVAYRSDDEPWDSRLRWRPSIFMPRRCSRLTLEITDIRVQRVQEISDTDALAEGVTWPAGEQEQNVRKWGYPQTAVAAYADLWDSINAQRGFGWESNPWVWAITFRRV